MEMYTDRLYLRPITINDTEMILNWRNSDAVKQFFIRQEDITVEEHLYWLEELVSSGKVCQFIICVKNEDKPIGSVYLQKIDTVNGDAEYGIFIGETSALGKGYGTEAGRLMLKYGFEKLNLKTIYLRVYADNIRAIRSYLRIGFRHENQDANQVSEMSYKHEVIKMVAIQECQNEKN